MKSYCIKGKRIRKVNIPNEFDICKIQIGVPVIGDEAEKVCLFEQGDMVLPCGNFGVQSRKNAYGYTYADKTKTKERRYVSTNWVYPFGNTNASMIAADIYKPCYPKVEVPPYAIELKLYQDKNGQKTDTYSIYRLEYMETFKSEKVVEGINGFNGYYAFVFKNYCVLESAVYGNATYIIPKEDWEILSQKTKKELFNEDKVIAKLDHTEKWQQNIKGMFNKLGIF